MTQQYLAGELSVLLERVQAVATTEAAGRDAWLLRQAAETVPVHALGWVTVRALALTERCCWDSLSRKAGQRLIGLKMPRERRPRVNALRYETRT